MVGEHRGQPGCVYEAGRDELPGSGTDERPTDLSLASGAETSDFVTTSRLSLLASALVTLRHLVYV